LFAEKWVEIISEGIGGVVVVVIVVVWQYDGH